LAQLCKDLGKRNVKEVSFMGWRQQQTESERPMLFTIDSKRIAEIPRSRADHFRAVTNTLGPSRTQDVQAEFDRLLDELPGNTRTGKRTFNSSYGGSSSYVGSSLSSWAYPLGYLYDAAVQMAGENTPEDDIQQQSAFSFGLFAWECVINPDEVWTVSNPNLPGDKNNDVPGKVYFEQ
jgi:hypothetical protein